jgi:cytoskeletal protein CcmA (bactofilin family)
MSFWKKGNSDKNTPNLISPSGNWQSNTTNTNVSLDSQTEKVNKSTIEQRFGAVRSALSANTSIQGKLSFDMPVRIDGKLTGEFFSTQLVIIGESAEISANINAPIVVILGKLKGSIVAKDKIEIYENSEVEGQIIAPKISIFDGALFNGQITIS